MRSSSTVEKRLSREVERVLSAHATFAKVGVTSIRDARLGEVRRVVVVPLDGASAFWTAFFA